MSRINRIVPGLLASSITLGAIAADKQFTPQNGSNSWLAGSNWSPTGTPGGNDDVYILGTNFVILDTDTAAIDALVLEDGATLLSNGHKITVDQSVTRVSGLGAFLGVGGAVFGRDWETHWCEILDQGRIVCDGVSASIDVLMNIDGGFLDGSGLIDFQEEGQSSLVNDGLITAQGNLRLRVPGTSTIDLDGAGGNGAALILAEGRLSLEGSLHDAMDGVITVESGGRLHVTRPWTLGSAGNLDFTGGNAASEITGSSFVVDGAWTINGTAVDVEPEAWVRTGASLTVTSGSMNVTSRLENDGLVAGAGALSIVHLQNRGSMTVGGTIDSSLIENDGVISADGALHVDAQLVDLDGSTGDGELHASAGHLTIDALAATVPFGGRLVVGNGQTMHFEDTTVELVDNAAIELAGGTLRAERFEHAGVGPFVHVQAPSQLEADGPIASVLNGPMTLEADLVLEGTFDLGAQLATAGNGRVVNRGTLGVIGPLNHTLPGHVHNEGTFRPGGDLLQSLTLDGDFHQTADGTLVLQLGLLSDQLVVSGVAGLGGELRIETSGFTPAPGATFDLLIADAYAGAFDTVDLPFPAKVVYAADRVTLEIPVVCAGDTNADGVIDIVDLLEVLIGWGGSGPGDVNADGIIDTVDLLTVIAGWGTC